MDIIYNSSTSLQFNTSSPPHRRRCIDGKITGCGNCVGFCKFNGHPGYLTKELRKKHDCIKKACHYYVPKAKSVTIQSPFAVLTALI